MAALQVIAGSFLQLPQKLSPWALDVFCLCTKSLKSSGAGEPSYRIASVQTAVAVAQACRQARSQMQQQQGLESSSPLLYPGAMEDRALQESLRLIKQAVTDKYPEVREAAAHFCAALAPLLVLPIGLRINSRRQSTWKKQSNSHFEISLMSVMLLSFIHI